MNLMTLKLKWCRQIGRRGRGKTRRVSEKEEIKEKIIGGGGKKG